MNKFFKKMTKLFIKRTYVEVTICAKDSKTGEILHTYPVYRLYEGDTLKIGPVKFDVKDAEWT